MQERVVHDDHAARAHDRADLRQRLVVDRHVEVLGRDAAAGGAAGLDRLERRGRRRCRRRCRRRSRAAVMPIGTSIRPVLRDPPGQGEDLGALALLGADAGEPVAAVADDRRDVGEGLDVVDQRRAGPTGPTRPGTAGAAGACRACPRSRRSAPSPRRTRTRPAPSRMSTWKLERRVDDAGARAARARSAWRIAVSSRATASGYSARTVDVALAGADGVGGDRHALEHPVRVALQDAAVHERAGVALVGVADHVLLRAGGLGDRAPTSGRSGSRRRRGRAGRCAMISSTHLGRRQLGQRRRAAPGSRRAATVVLEALGVDPPGVLGRRPGPGGRRTAPVAPGWRRAGRPASSPTSGTEVVRARPARTAGRSREPRPGARRRTAPGSRPA